MVNRQQIVLHSLKSHILQLNFLLRDEAIRLNMLPLARNIKIREILRRQLRLPRLRIIIAIRLIRVLIVLPWARHIRQRVQPLKLVVKLRLPPRHVKLLIKLRRRLLVVIRLIIAVLRNLIRGLLILSDYVPVHLLLLRRDRHNEIPRVQQNLRLLVHNYLNPEQNRPESLVYFLRRVAERQPAKNFVQRHPVNFKPRTLPVVFQPVVLQISAFLLLPHRFDQIRDERDQPGAQTAFRQQTQLQLLDADELIVQRLFLPIARQIIVRLPLVSQQLYAKLGVILVLFLLLILVLVLLLVLLGVEPLEVVLNHLKITQISYHGLQNSFRVLSVGVGALLIAQNHNSLGQLDLAAAQPLLVERIALDIDHHLRVLRLVNQILQRWVRPVRHQDHRVFRLLAVVLVEELFEEVLGSD